MANKEVSTMVNDSINELRAENNRLLDELLNANKCREVLSLIKSFIELIFEKYSETFDANDNYNYEKLVKDAEEVLRPRSKTSEQTIVKTEVSDHTNGDNERQGFEYLSRSPLDSSVLNKSVNPNTSHILLLRTEGQPEGHPEGQPEGQPEAQPEKQPEERPEEQPERQPEGQPKRQPAKRRARQQKKKTVSKTEATLAVAKEWRLKEAKLAVKGFKCDGCDQVFPLRSTLKQHMKSHYRTKFHCTEDACDKSYGSTDRLRRHLYRCHSQKDPRLRCQWSGCPFLGTMDELKRHRISHKSYYLLKNNFTCKHPDCHFRAKNNTCIGKHMETCPFLKDKSKRAIHACEVEDCGQKFASLDAFFLHMKTEHNVDKPFACDVPECDYRATKRCALTQHKAMQHQVERPHVCPHCGKTFKMAKAMRDHEKNVHIAPDKFRCEWPGCDYSSCGSNNIKIHKLVHTKERNVECDVDKCGQRFRTKYEMGVHKRSFHKLGPLLNCQWPGCEFTTYHPITFYSHVSHHKSRNA